MIQIAADMDPQVVPLAWLVGRWEGAGVGDYPTIDAFRFGQSLEVSYVPEKPFLVHESRSWYLDDDGNIGRALARETGYWRPQPDGQVELLLAHPTGIVEVWIGEITGTRVELRTDAVARTSTAKPYVAGHRLYGLIEGGDLGYVFEMAAMDQALQPHLSAQLKPPRAR
jgi:hypothetical protein